MIHVGWSRSTMALASWRSSAQLTSQFGPSGFAARRSSALSPVDNSPVLDCVISGAEGSHNTFSGNLAFNVYLQDCQDGNDATHNFWGVANPDRILASKSTSRSNTRCRVVNAS